MSTRFPDFCLAALLFAGLLAAPSRLSAKDSISRLTEVIANAELSKDGEKFPRPTPGHPVYYVPVISGWHEEGALVAGEEPPKRATVLREVGQALAKEVYVLQALRPDANTTVPSLIITVEWGYINPVITHEGAMSQTTRDGGTMAVAEMRDDPTQRESTFLNQREMVTLVAGSAIQRQVLLTEVNWQKLNEAFVEDRYYIIVSAYDFAASLKGEQVLLWRTRMSTPRQGVWMNDVVSALVVGGAPLFGRQSDVPKWTDLRVRDGKVILGESTVVDADVKLPASEKSSENKSTKEGSPKK